MTSPSGSVLPSKMALKAFMRQATNMPTQEPGEHGDAAQRRGGPGVHPPLVGPDHGADAHGQVPDQRHGAQRW